MPNGTQEEKRVLTSRARIACRGIPAYNLLRMILPLMVLGSSVRNSTILGYL